MSMFTFTIYDYLCLIPWSIISIMFYTGIRYLVFCYWDLWFLSCLLLWFRIILMFVNRICDCFNIWYQDPWSFQCFILDTWLFQRLMLESVNMISGSVHISMFHTRYVFISVFDAGIRDYFDIWYWDPLIFQCLILWSVIISMFDTVICDHLMFNIGIRNYFDVWYMDPGLFRCLKSGFVVGFMIISLFDTGIRIFGRSCGSKCGCIIIFIHVWMHDVLFSRIKCRIHTITQIKSVIYGTIMWVESVV